jgi:hypothetical protein
MAKRARTPKPVSRRELVVLEHPSNLQHPRNREAFAEAIADIILVEVNAARARLGKPPLV